MRYFTFIGILTLIVVMFGCSTNENNPVSSDPGNNTLTLTVTFGQEYYINLAQKAAVEIETPMIDDNWDIVIDNLTRIRLNGGSTAPGQVYSYPLNGIEYESVNSAPEAVYETDTQDELSIGEDWYYYDFNTHTVNPLDVIYILRSNDQNFYKLQITDAVFSSRTDGELDIRIERINAPANFNVITPTGRIIHSRISLSNSENNFFNFKQAGPVTIEDEMTSLEWHLKSDFVTLHLNGGSSGSGTCAAQMIQDIQFDSLSSAPATGYSYDDSTTALAIGNTWYTYDMSSHTLTPNPYIYVLQINQTDYAKIEFILTDFSGQESGVAVIRYQYVEGTRDF